MAPCNLQPKDDDDADLPSEQQKFWQTDCADDSRIHDSLHAADAEVEDANSTVCDDLLAGDDVTETGLPSLDGVNAGGPNADGSNADAGETAAEELPVRDEQCNNGNSCEQNESNKYDGTVIYGIRMMPSWKYVWNEYLIRKFQDDVHSDWLLFIIHGFVGQSKISVFGRCIYVALIARRSNQFAGTRFLKRGANHEGYVANEVETEQIVCDSSLTLFTKLRFTSFVQLRGSIPLHWSQDINKMVPKPPISLDQADPYGHVAGQHFNQLLHRYGAPIIILDLVKRREKKRHESIISQELVNVLQYLNQFLPSEHAIKYIGFDMARVSKTKNTNVLMKLAKIAEYSVKKTGFFQSHPSYYCRQIRPNHRCRNIISRLRQHGVVRTNCIDCLDRTNTAQFAIGKTALAMQLHALGIIDTPNLDFESDCVRMMEDLYEDQGDTLALQYGGSQLVHRIKGYRKVSAWTSSSRDIMQTLSRYYSNAFSDSDKQNAINLFLGMFEPVDGQLNIWDLTTDFYLHNSITMKGPVPRTRRYTQWWDLAAVKSLPYPCDEEAKGLEDQLMLVKAHEHDERIDSYYEHYRPYELTVLSEQFCFNMSCSIRDFMPKYASNFSAFIARVEPGRRQEEFGTSVTEANPNVSGKDSTSSTTSTGSEGSTSGSDGSELEGTLEDSSDEGTKSKRTKELGVMSLKDLFATMKQTYGVEIEEPTKSSVDVYRRYVTIGDNSTCIPQKASSTQKFDLKPMTIPSGDCSQCITPPVVGEISRTIYEEYVARNAKGAGPPTYHDLQLYHEYAAKK